jgi:hypothetical protein
VQGKCRLRGFRIGERGSRGLDEDEMGDDGLEGSEDGAKQSEEEAKDGEVIIAISAVRCQIEMVWEAKKTDAKPTPATTGRRERVL